VFACLTTKRPQTEAKAKSKVFAQHLSELEERRKKEQLEALEAEAERSKQPRKTRVRQNAIFFNFVILS
jgi:hypothetical protein